MKSLDDRINNLIATKKDFKIIDISKYQVKAPNTGAAVKIPVEYPITNNTSIMGTFRKLGSINDVGSVAGIGLTKNNFSVESKHTDKSGVYGATLYRSNNAIFLKSSQNKDENRVHQGSYLLFTDDL